MAKRELDVVLYGATGYTGRLIAHALDDLGADYAIAGRNQDKLEGLAAGLDHSPSTYPIGVDEPDRLEAMAAKAEVVLSAAGPFEALGPPVFEAALRAGSHFADITGEQPYLRWAHRQDERAREAGVTVVNALGFDVVPSDLAAYTAAEGLEEITRLDLGIATNAGRSAGTLRTMATSAGRGWWYEAGVYHRGPPGRFVRSFTFPNELGERTCVFIPWGDVVTAPRSTGARVVRTFFVTKASTARKMHLSWPVTGAVSWLVGKVPYLQDLLASRVPPSGEGPSPGQRAEARFSVLAEATAPSGEVQRALVTGRDPYGLTGAAAAQGALALARGEVEDVGVLTPTQAFGGTWWPKVLSGFDLEARRLEDA